MDTVFQLTYIFCQRFKPKYGDRTVDQMVQAARFGKQNIIEGSEDGKTSTQMELKLPNVARSSVGELREDYRDHINNHHLVLWDSSHPRHLPMQELQRSAIFLKRICIWLTNETKRSFAMSASRYVVRLR